MKMHGTIVQNLESAVASITRFRGRFVYTETLAHWNALLDPARLIRADVNETRATSLDPLIGRLEAELQRRAAEPPMLDRP
jgi:hypothetical protein